MRGVEEVEAVRHRPLSGGLWTLFSWLRRDERASVESVSSIGSDRTTVSFHFLEPKHFPPQFATPILLPPPSPPTDSYKKRLHDRNLRRHQERDITLHRKYGLFRGDGYNTISLPSDRHNKGKSSDRLERDRRATSELGQRPIAHVVGKRRAPPPPSRAYTLGATPSLTRRPRKRPAPPPPPTISNTDFTHQNSKNTVMEPNNASGSCINNENSMGCKSEKYSKNACKTKHLKPRSEKNFLKQIFENKKRNSTMESIPEKLLPNISELDKQASEIIKMNKLKELRPTQGDNWFCTKCLRKYEASVVSCLYCVHDKTDIGHSSNLTAKLALSNFKQNNSDLTNHQDLKKMLKEIKDSIPKTSKANKTRTHNEKKVNLFPNESNILYIDAPTLPIGSSARSNREKINFESSRINNNDNEPTKKIKVPSANKTAVVTQTCVLVDASHKDNTVIDKTKKQSGADIPSTSNKESIFNEQTKLQISKSHKDEMLNVPFRISSLLNPVYVPKEIISNKQLAKKKFFAANEPQPVGSVKKIDIHDENQKQVAPTTHTAVLEPTQKITSQEEHEIVIAKPTKESKPNTATSDNTASTSSATETANKTSVKFTTEKADNSERGKFPIDHYLKRRELINQLEQSIAKGDERAAADAAVKLAQLRLSCSVLSFSSHILKENSIPQTDKLSPRSTPKESNDATNDDIAQSLPKVDATTQSKVRITPAKEGKPINVDTPSTSKKENLCNGDKIQAQASTSNISVTKNNDNNSHQPNPEATTSKQNNDEPNDMIKIDVWIEDREAARGPVPLHISKHATMGALRQIAETSLGLASNLQRWIVGRTLCTDDNTLLASVAGPNLTSPFYLCLVESKARRESVHNKALDEVQIQNQTNVYTELVQLEQQALVPNTEPFECPICIDECVASAGAVLRDCVHMFCKNCLSDLVRHCEEPVVSCPATGCHGTLQEREIRVLVSPEEYEKWLARGLRAAECGTRNSFHCRTRDCTGWALCEPGVQRFPCPVCKCINCVPCQAIHTGETCEEHRTKLQKAEKVANADQCDEGTRALLDSLISRGEALECPECKAVITKKWGCDWVKCSACKTEICWVTRGRRWGAEGRGDTSGGCRCGVDGKKCHPSCGYCH